MEPSIKPGRTVAFPCIENPFRVSLFCNGNYLWCLNRVGKAGARRRRADRDDFQLIETDNRTSVMLVNHKFGSVLSVVKNRRGIKKVRFIAQEGIPEEEGGEDLSSQETLGGSMTESDDMDYGSSSSTDFLESAESVDTSEDDNDDENDLVGVDVSIDCQKWQFLESLDGYVCMENVGTRDRLGIDSRGRCTLFPDDAPVGPQNLWTVEPVTGELCFLSNAKTDSRIRCDMSGRLSMSSNWKGWEIFRFLEAGNGYVKICGWTHSQWILKCHASGKVQTGRQSDFHTDQNWCSLWAVEIAPEGKGVIIKSRSFGRFLCVRKNGNALMIATYHPFDEVDSGTDSDCFSDGNDHAWYADGLSRSQSDDTGGAIGSPTQISQEAFVQDALARRNTVERRNQRRWFRRRYITKGEINGQNATTDNDTLPVQAASESIFWHLEAAHQQQYFLSAQAGDPLGNITIGPFPSVTRNFRRTDNFCLIRKIAGEEKNTIVVAQLFHLEREQYVACCDDGRIALTSDMEDESTEWIMSNSDTHGGTSFQSKFRGHYLSFANVEEISTGKSFGNDPTSPRNQQASPTKRSQKQFPSLFGGRSRDSGDNTDSELVGYTELSKHGCWILGPCVPRALNVRKVRKFALGTSLVLGSSLALPFALVGVGAVLHVGGHAGVAYHVVVAGLSSADTVSSVGAVGATAYLVFRAQGVSLGDRVNRPNHDGSEQDRARFKRPFCEWRNWEPDQES